MNTPTEPATSPQPATLAQILKPNFRFEPGQTPTSMFTALQEVRTSAEARVYLIKVTAYNETHNNMPKDAAYRRALDDVNFMAGQFELEAGLEIMKHFQNAQGTHTPEAEQPSSPEPYTLSQILRPDFHFEADQTPIRMFTALQEVQTPAEARVYMAKVADYNEKHCGMPREAAVRRAIDDICYMAGSHDIETSNSILRNFTPAHGDGYKQSFANGMSGDGKTT